MERQSPWMVPKIGKIIARLYLVAVILFMPFYLQDKYFDMTYAKARFLWIVGGILLLAYTAFYLINICIVLKPIYQKKGKRCKCLSVLTMIDVSVFLFCISTWCSFLVSHHRKSSFWGNDGWFMGCLTITILTGMYFIVRKYIRICTDKFIVVMAAVSIAVLGIWGIAHSFHIDIGKLHEGMSNDFYDYIMTIGNVNWYVGILSMIFPMICMLYLTAEEKYEKYVAAIYVDIVCYQLIICRSNGIFLGIFCGGIIMLAYLISHPKKIWRFLSFVLHIAVVMGMTWGISHFYKGEYVKADSICFFMMEKKIWLFVGVIDSILLLLYGAHKKYGKRSRFYKGCKWVIVGVNKYRWEIFCFSIVLVIGFLVLYEVSRFSDSWGTKRGVIWIYAVKIWNKFKWKYKVFGCGCDCFGIVFMNTYGEYVNKVYLNAHNEFLQYLVTTGILGFLSYSTIWVSVFLEFIKKKHRTSFDWVLFSGLFGYLGQALVNNPQALNYAVLFVLLALYAGIQIENSRILVQKSSN